MVDSRKGPLRQSMVWKWARIAGAGAVPMLGGASLQQNGRRNVSGFRETVDRDCAGERLAPCRPSKRHHGRLQHTHDTEQRSIPFAASVLSPGRDCLTVSSPQFDRA